MLFYNDMECQIKKGDFLKKILFDTTGVLAVGNYFKNQKHGFHKKYINGKIYSKYYSHGRAIEAQVLNEDGELEYIRKFSKQ
jgi:hypothetical protein